MGFKFLYVVDSSSAVSPKLVGFQRRAERSFHHLNSKYALLRYAATPTEKSLKTEALSSLRKSLKPSREMLEIFRSKLDPTHANYFESAFQADSQLVHFFNTGIIDAIVSNDSDILAIYGAPFIVKQLRTDKVIIASLSPIAILEAYCPASAPSSPIYSPLDTRAQSIAWSAIIGCDLLPGGIKGAGFKFLQTYLDSNNRVIELICNLFSPIQREAVLSAINAGLYEPVFDDLRSEIRVYLSSQTPETLYETNQSFKIHDETRIQSLATVNCATGHNPPALFTLLKCQRCSRDYCNLCARLKKPATIESFICIGCLFNLDDILTMDDPDEESTLSLVSSTQGLRSIFHYRVENPMTTLRPEFLDDASQHQLISFLQAYHVQIPNSQTELASLCRDILSGNLTSAYLSAHEEEERALIRQSFPKETAPWAYPMESPPNLSLLNDTALDELDCDHLIAFATILEKFLPSKTASSGLPAELSALSNKLKSTVSLFSCKDALLYRPFGGAERMLKMALRTLLSPKLSSLTACHFKLYLLEGTWVLNLVGSVPASMKAIRYDTSIFLSSSGLRFVKCSCPAGALCCQHCFALLLKLEMASLSPFELLRTIFNLLVDKYITPITYHQHETLLRRLMKHFHPTVTDTAGWLLPPNDLPRSAPSSQPIQPLVHTFYKHFVFESPIHAHARSPKQMNLTESVLFQYDPLNGVDFDVNAFDWYSIYLSMAKGKILPFSIGFDLVTIRAERQIRDVISHGPSIPEQATSNSLSSSTHDAATITSPLILIAADQQRDENECKKRTRTTRKCYFPHCPCRNSDCQKRWTTCPPSKSCMKNPKKLEQRKLFLQAIGLSPSTAPVDLRICGCHAVINGIPVSKGVNHFDMAESERIEPARQRRFQALNQPTDPTSQELTHLIERIDFYETEMLRLRLELDVQKKLVENLEVSKQIPTFHFELLAADPVRFFQYTHFRSKDDFYGYVDLLCNGNRSLLYRVERFRHDRIQPDGTYLKKPRDQSESRLKARRKKLQPIDELFIYFARCNEIPAATLAHDFGVAPSLISQIVVKWARFENLRVKAFGEMLTYDLYQKLCPENWKLLFPDVRVHMWDTTDLRLNGKPSNPELQRLFWSQYYSHNVVKVGVGMTPFGWLMAGPAFSGGQSDSDYLEVSGIYERQQALAEADGGPPVLNYTDRGFRDAGRVYQRRGQQLITPCFLKYSRFSLFESLMSTDRGNKRARNERAVRLPKALTSVIDMNIPPPVMSLIWERSEE